MSLRTSGVRQTQTADWQTNEVNIVVECSNRFPIPTLDFQMTYTLGIGALLKHSTPKFSSFTCQFASLQSAFVAHRFTSFITEFD